MEKLQRITSEDVLNNGLNWVKSFDKFEVVGNHYVTLRGYTSMLTDLKGYDHNTEFYGSGDQGTAVTTFTKRVEKGVINVVGISIDFDLLGSKRSESNLISGRINIDFSSSGDMSHLKGKDLFLHIHDQLPVSF